jgi:hypothetical protein
MTFLDVFAELQKTAIIFITFVCAELVSDWVDFHEI